MEFWLRGGFTEQKFCSLEVLSRGGFYCVEVLFFEGFVALNKVFCFLGILLIGVSYVYVVTYRGFLSQRFYLKILFHEGFVV